LAEEVTNDPLQRSVSCG